MMEDVEMKDSVMSPAPAPSQSNSLSSSTGLSTLQHPKEIASLIEPGAHAKEGRKIVRAVRLTVMLRRKLRTHVISSFLASVLVPGSEAYIRLASYLTKGLPNPGALCSRAVRMAPVPDLPGTPYRLQIASPSFVLPQICFPNARVWCLPFSHRLLKY